MFLNDIPLENYSGDGRIIRRNPVKVYRNSPSEMGCHVCPGENQLGSLAGKEAKTRRVAQAKTTAAQIVASGAPLSKQVLKQYGISSGKLSQQVLKQTRTQATAANNAALAKSAKKALQKIKAKNESKGLLNKVIDTTKKAARLDIKGAIRGSADIVRDSHDKLAKVSGISRIDPRTSYLNRKAKANSKIEQTKKDLRGAQTPEEIARLQQRLKHKKKQKATLMKNASVVGTVAGIVASFFIPGVAPLMQQALVAMQNGATSLGQKLVGSAISKAAAGKLNPSQQAKLTKDVSSYMGNTGQMPDEATYNAMVQKYVDEMQPGNSGVVSSGNTESAQGVNSEASKTNGLTIPLLITGALALLSMG